MEAGFLSVVKAAPGAVVVAVHLESLDHCLLTREVLREMGPSQQNVFLNTNQIMRL